MGAPTAAFLPPPNKKNPAHPLKPKTLEREEETKRPARPRVVRVFCCSGVFFPTAFLGKLERSSKRQDRFAECKGAQREVCRKKVENKPQNQTSSFSTQKYTDQASFFYGRSAASKHFLFYGDTFSRHQSAPHSRLKCPRLQGWKACGGESFKKCFL